MALRRAQNAFRIGVQERDAGCVGCGMMNSRGFITNDWGLFEAAHIFPVEKENQWVWKEFDKHITDMPDYRGQGKIHSIRYLWAINPDVSDSIIPCYFSQLTG